MRSYTDDQLIEAVTVSHSWRGVLRALGLAATSASAMRSVRRHADRLGLNYRHFTGQRRWTHKQLEDAVATSRSWSEVAEVLGLAGGSSTVTVKGHAARLGLDARHFTAVRQPSATALQPERVNLPRAGTLMAAAWFELCGLAVSWPLEPCRYDLLVWRDDKAERVQVKTTNVASGSSWTVWLSNTGKERRRYDPEEIDQFFVIDGDLRYYLIPVSVVGGLASISTSAYRGYRLPQLGVGRNRRPADA